ncbi:hypothetical protein ANTPLA_LOCUS4419 [Anthophora plagiata]
MQSSRFQDCHQDSNRHTFTGEVLASSGCENKRTKCNINASLVRNQSGIQQADTIILDDMCKKMKNDLLDTMLRITTAPGCFASRVRYDQPFPGR